MQKCRTRVVLLRGLYEYSKISSATIVKRRGPLIPEHRTEEGIKFMIPSSVDAFSFHSRGWRRPGGCPRCLNFTSSFCYFIKDHFMAAHVIRSHPVYYITPKISFSFVRSMKLIAFKKFHFKYIIVTQLWNASKHWCCSNNVQEKVGLVKLSSMQFVHGARHIIIFEDANFLCFLLSSLYRSSNIFSFTRYNLNF